VLIIEDEPVIAMDIAGIVRQAGHECSASPHPRPGGRHGRSQPPGLDPRRYRARRRQLRHQGGRRHRPSGRAAPRARIPAIFITAFPERLLDDERLEPSLLITKPFSDHLLRVAIAQALQMAGVEASTAA
jgi:hypothetical protein